MIWSKARWGEGYSILADIPLLIGYVLFSVPRATKTLARWKTRASEIPDPLLSAQAKESIGLKRFHCQGGAVYAMPGGEHYIGMIEGIVALQTISDYLDNLCDRAGVFEEASFRQLHLAMMEALDPGGEKSDYYALYPRSDDGGYLSDLVETTRDAVSSFPSYTKVLKPSLRFAGLYSDLQSFKHIEVSQRKKRLIEWHREAGHIHPEIHWWEFAAASGSTLGIFALMKLATEKHVPQDLVRDTCDCYFPYISGLHILLDYLIDLEEDREAGDFNLVAMYPDKEEVRRRLRFFIKESLERTTLLPNPNFHRTVVKGLLAMYLSDPKVSAQGLEPLADELLEQGGRDVTLMMKGCKALRALGII